MRRTVRPLGSHPHLDFSRRQKQRRDVGAGMRALVIARCADATGLSTARWACNAHRQCGIKQQAFMFGGNWSRRVVLAVGLFSGLVARP